MRKTGLADHAAPPFDPTASRQTHRVSTILATSAELPGPAHADGTPPSQQLYLGRLARFYDACTDQLPRVLVSEWLDPQSMEFKRWQHRGRRISRARLWVFSVPAAPAVITLSLDVQASTLQLIPLLEDCYYADVREAGCSLADLAVELLHRSSAVHDDLDQLNIEPECHQLVFLSEALPTRERK